MGQQRALFKRRELCADRTMEHDVCFAGNVSQRRVKSDRILCLINRHGNVHVQLSSDFTGKLVNIWLSFSIDSVCSLEQIQSDGLGLSIGRFVFIRLVAGLFGFRLFLLSRFMFHKPIPNLFFIFDQVITNR